MKKLLAVVMGLQVAFFITYLWQRSAAEAERGAGAGAPGNVNGDVNGDGDRDISDAIFLLSFLFSGGPAPVACAQEPGLDGFFESLRVAAPDGSGRVRFGNNPDNICAVGIDPPGGLSGLLLEDIGGARIIIPPAGGTRSSPRLLFGPTDDCSIGIDPALSGLILRDPRGIRALGAGNEGTRLIFGPTDLCMIGIDRQGPPGLLLRDPQGVRVLDDARGSPALRFGPTDDCSIGISPVLTGLILRDPRGLRLVGVPTPDGTTPPTIRFGPTDDCTIGISPALSGLILRDPRGTRLLGVPTPDGGTTSPALRFGPTDDCTIGIDPAFPGLIATDPTGLRLLGRENRGMRLIFGPTDDCTIGIEPAVATGLLLRDPRGIRILPASSALPGEPPPPARLIFGPTDDCSISVEPERKGLVLRDPTGFFFEGGPVFASQFVQTSSAQLKRDVKPIPDALAKVCALQGVAFRWNEAHGGRQDVGFLAEDVAAVLPEVVRRDETTRAPVGVSYGQVVAVAVEGIKTQQQQIEDLRSRNAALEKELSELKAQVALIAATITRPAAPADGR